MFSLIGRGSARMQNKAPLKRGLVCFRRQEPK